MHGRGMNDEKEGFFIPEDGRVFVIGGGRVDDLFAHGAGYPESAGTVSHCRGAELGYGYGHCGAFQPGSAAAFRGKRQIAGADRRGNGSYGQSVRPVSGKAGARECGRGYPSGAGWSGCGHCPGHEGRDGGGRFRCGGAEPGKAGGAAGRGCD